MRFRSYGYSAPKIFEFQKDLEDCCMRSSSKVIISDGASESFNSALWAECLIAAVLDDNKPFSVETVKKARQQYSKGLDFPSLSWSQQLAASKGSFATILLAEKANAGTEVCITAIGDSEAFLIDAQTGAMVECFPYKTHEEFLQRPVLLSTRPEHDSLFDEDGWEEKHRVTWDLSGRLLFLMTDAIADWALKIQHEEHNFWINLCKAASSTNSDDIINEIIKYERNQKNLKVDDVTIVVTKLEEDNIPTE